MSVSFEDTINAIKGKNYSHLIPHSMWKHFTPYDRTVNDLIKSHIMFQELSQSSLIKFSPNSKFCLLDWGLEIGTNYNDETGSYITRNYPINSVSDWEKIDEIDPLDGEFGNQLKALKKVSRNFEGTPVMMTIFLPMMVADKLVSNNKLIDHLEKDPKLVRDRLKVILKVINDFAFSCLDEGGSDGLFLATQHGEFSSNWNEKLWKKYILPIDKLCVNNVYRKSLFTILHLHGNNIFFRAFTKNLKFHGLNYHVSNTLPEILTGSKKRQFLGGILGGIEENKLNDYQNEDDMKDYLKSILEHYQNHDNQLLIAPGCVLSQKTTNDSIQLMAKIIKELNRNLK